ncbi:MAG: hypothetical protein ACI9XO_004681 [Paraglaciecola sp.]|jgi:uncharacterized protein YacL
MLNSDQSFYAKSYSPYVQSAVVLGISLGCMILGEFLELAGMEMDATNAWLLSATFIMFFIIFNSVISLSSKDMEVYYRQSMLSFAALVAISGGTAWLLSGISLNDAGYYKWIFIVLAVVYVVFMAIMGFMKFIVEFAQKEEWNQPRIRNRGNKGTKNDKAK